MAMTAGGAHETNAYALDVSFDSMARRFTIRPSGPFNLQELALFGFGQRFESEWSGVMRLAFCMDGGFAEQVGVEVRQDETGVHVLVSGEADLERVAPQVARVLSLDHDGERFLEVGRRDPVIGQLQAAAPGLRPPLFYSPYEAAAWSIISARRPRAQAAVVRSRLSEAHGRRFELEGGVEVALPTPTQLLAITAFPGLSVEKIERLHGVARAALEGRLEAAELVALEPEAAMERLQSLKGIGPFSSALIVIRACGHADVLPTQEPRALELIRRHYALDSVPSVAELERIAEPWRPFRTWSVVLVRAVSGRLARTEV